MSKPSIKFIYSGEIRSQVQHLQKGPSPLQNFTGFFSQSQNEPPSQNKMNPLAYAPVPIVSSVDINSRTNLQTLRRHRSSDNFPPLPQQPQLYETNTPILNTEDMQYSEQKIISQKYSNADSKNGSRNQPEQIVLKAPSYKYTPKRQGQIVHSKKDYKKTSSIEKPLNADIVLKSKKKLKNSNSTNQMNFKSSNAMFQVQAIKQSDFYLEPTASAATSSKPSKKQESIINFDDQQIVLKAPKYQYTPSSGGSKKEYVKAQNSEKYLYEGVKVHREKDFVSCFGCSQPKAKTYKNEDV